MKKLILKTVAFTLSGVILLMALLYGIFALFSPITLANVYDSVGNYSLSVHYYECAYNKSNSIENVYILCERVDENSDAERAEKYLTIFVESDEFSSFCAQKDLVESQDFMKSEDFYYGKYVLSIFNNDKESLGFTNALIKCEERVKAVGYKNYSPFSILIMAGELSDSQLNSVEQKITEILPLLSANEQNFANQDIETIQFLKNNS